MWGRLTGLASSVTGLQGHDAQQVGTFYTCHLYVLLLFISRLIQSCVGLLTDVQSKASQSGRKYGCRVKCGVRGNDNV